MYIVVLSRAVVDSVIIIFMGIVKTTVALSTILTCMIIYHLLI